MSVAQKLVTDKRVAFFSFIGSSTVGWKLRSLNAPGTRVALEHGGVAPVIVCPTAKKDQFVPSLVKCGFYHSGQVCVPVQRVFCLNSSGKELADSIADQATKLVVGNAIEVETQCGPLIRNRKVKGLRTRLQRLLRRELKVYAVVKNYPVPVIPLSFCLIFQKLAGYRDMRSLVR